MVVSSAAFWFSMGFLTNIGVMTPALYMVRRRALAAEKAALTDALTGLSNRAGFFTFSFEILRTHASASQPVMVAMLDLNGFKRINDEWGHDIGDWVLITTAQRLRSTAGNRGMVARLGGDEFAIIIPTPPDSSDHSWILETADLICIAVAEPLILAGYHLPSVTISMGIQLVTNDTADLHHVLHHADIAMYYTKKKQPHAGFSAYDPLKMPDPSPLSHQHRPPIRVRELGN